MHQADKSNDSKKLFTELVKQHSGRKDERKPFEAAWEHVAQFMGPMYQGWAGDNAELKLNLNENVVDSTAQQASFIFQSGMLSGTSNPSERWQSQTVADRDMLEFGQVKHWLQDLEDDYYHDLEQGGYYMEAPTGFHQLGLFGMRVMYVDESLLEGIRFKAIPLYGVYIGENFQGVVDTIDREFRLDARQAAQKFGLEKLPKKIQEAYNRKNSQKFRFLHMVHTNMDHRPERADHRGLEFSSYYMNLDEEQVISEGGYASFPYLVNRYGRLPGTPYSFSPGTLSLADTMMLNEMKRLIIQAGQKSVSPAWWVPDDGVVGRVSTEPNALNYYDPTVAKAADMFQAMAGGDNPGFAIELLQAGQQDINAAWGVHLFQTIQNRIAMGSTPTASEVDELASERGFLLAPLMVQQKGDHDRLFDRMFSLKHQRGEIRPMPPELVGQELKAEYTGVLFRAQKAHQVSSILQSYQEAAMIAQFAQNPGVFDNFDHDANVRLIQELRGMHQDGIKAIEVVQAIRRMTEQVQQGGQMQAEMAQLAELLPNLSKAPEEGSPAQMYMKQMQKAQGGAQ